MNCTEATQLLLEAEGTELRADEPTPLSEHLKTCDRCRMAAQHISDQEQSLRGFLSAVRPRTPGEVAVQRAVEEARQRSRKRLWIGIAPALAAAGIAGILLVGNGGLTTTEPGEPMAAPSLRQEPLVESAPGQQVAVFTTDNPNIVVVWSF